ncbi:MAG: IS30 family transposase [Chitinophagales bacterium]
MSTHISKEERKVIAYCLSCNWKYTQIAQLLNRNRSVISRELKRNTGDDGQYRYGYAHQQYLKRREKAKQGYQKILHHSTLQNHIEVQLNEGHSPQQIAGRLAHIPTLPTVCTETIYQFIYTHRPAWCPLLCFKKTQYRRKRGTKKREKNRRIQQFRCIETRPVSVDTKQYLGDFEGDTVIGKGKKQRLLTHVDRKSGYGLVDVLHQVSSDIVQQHTIKRFSTLPDSKRRSITYDRGTEFGGDDSLVERYTGMMVYRAHAYHSWERGCNENFNGLLRRYFPKGTDFSTLTQADVDGVVHQLNHRPRKRLNYLTPYEVFVEGLDPVAFQTRT